MSAFLSTRLSGRVLQITLNDPSSRNALSLKAARELREVLAKGGFDALVLTSVGRVFCSGGQLADYAAMPTADEGRAVNDEIRAILDGLARLEAPTVACVGGDAFGGGVELMSCLDVVIAVPHAMLGLWQRKIGLSFGWGGGARLEDRVGAAVLKRLSLLTTPIAAHEALRLGLVDRVVQESELLDVGHATAQAMASLPREPLMTFKMFDRTREAAAFNSIWWNESHRAVLAKRKR